MPSHRRGCASSPFRASLIFFIFHPSLNLAPAVSCDYFIFFSLPIFERLYPKSPQHISFIMPALYQALGQRAVEAAPHLAKRGLSVNHTQSITLGIMAVYVVVIALLWNLPYVRWVLWPFKVGLLLLSFLRP
jgi:hypothetical protein